jgi:hypothetical protein
MSNARFVPALVASALASALGLGAESAPRLPSYPLPAEESFVYARTVGDKADEVEMRIRLVSEEGAQPYVELSSRAPDQEGLYRLDPGTLFATYSDVTTRGRDSTIRRTTTVLENRAKPKSGELLVSGTESLAQSLRLFPWGKGQKAKLVFLGSGGGGGNFSFELSVSGQEKIKAGGREIACWKAQLSLSGIFGSFVGKTSLWYSVAYPNYLVKLDGPSAGPGSPRSVMLLSSYSSSGAAEPASQRE